MKYFPRNRQAFEITSCSPDDIEGDSHPDSHPKNSGRKYRRRGHKTGYVTAMGADDEDGDDAAWWKLYLDQFEEGATIGGGHRLREIRKRRSLSQEAAAEALKISVRQFRRLENGEASLPIETLKAMAAVYEVPTESLVAPPGSPIPRPRRKPPTF